MYYSNSQEQFFVDEFDRMRQRQRQGKLYEERKFQETLKKELELQQDEEDKKKSWGRFDFSQRIKKSARGFLKNIKKNKKSENLASQISFSGNFSCDGGAIAAEPDYELGEEQNGEEENFEKVQVRERAKQAAANAMQKKLQMEKTAARMQKTIQKLKRIKTLLQVGKVGSALAGLASFGVFFLVTILIWIGQFIGRYILGIQLIPAYDWFDYLLMFIVGVFIVLLILPIIIYLGIYCKLTLGLVC